MKKRILVILSIVLCTLSVAMVDAKATKSPELASAIRLYKAKDYSASYVALNNIVKKDPSNALAHYYLAMASVQMGRNDEAISNYTDVINLSPNGILGKYAAKGKMCIEYPDRCHESTDAISDPEDAFIRGQYGSGFSNKARSDFEKQKIENLMREMNRGEDLQPGQFREYKDFSGYAPSNDEIVSALRTLQRAGLTDFINVNNNYSDLSLLTGGYNNQNAILNMLNSNNPSSVNPQVLQSLLTNQMSIGF